MDAVWAPKHAVKIIPKLCFNCSLLVAMRQRWEYVWTCHAQQQQLLGERKEKACVHRLCALPISPRHTLAVSSLVYDRHHAAPFCPPLPHRQIPFSRSARRSHVRHHRAAVITVGPHGVICKRRQLELGSCGLLHYIILD